MSINNNKIYIFMWFGFLLALCFGIISVGFSNNFTLSKDQTQFWDLTLKGLGGIVAASGAAIAIMKYIDEQAKANRAALIEANKPFMTKRQEIYYELVSATAVLSIESNDAPEWIKSDAIFWRLYWGVLPLVTDDLVGAATNRFEDAMLSEALEGEEKLIAMRNASMELAKACRVSLGFA